MMLEEVLQRISEQAKRKRLTLPDQKTKIVCTIGPASRSPEVLAGLARAGMNVARLNRSHGTFDEHRENIRNIRAAAEETGLPITILIDLPGPKIRIGDLANGPLQLEKGEVVTLGPKARDMIVIQHNMDTIDRRVVGWLETSDGGKSVAVRDLPQREHIDVPVRESLIVELYSK